MRLEELPPELILQIVSHLPTRDLARWTVGNRQHQRILEPLLIRRQAQDEDEEFDPAWLPYRLRRASVAIFKDIADSGVPPPVPPPEPGKPRPPLHVLVAMYFPLTQIEPPSSPQSDERWAIRVLTHALRLALDDGLDVNARDTRGRTLLMEVSGGLPGMNVTQPQRLLLARGADPALADADGYTALHRAMVSGPPLRGRLPLPGPCWRQPFAADAALRVQTLVSHGGGGGGGAAAQLHVRARSPDGHTALDVLAALRFDPEPRDGEGLRYPHATRDRACAMLLRAGAAPSLHLACAADDAGLVRLLLRRRRRRHVDVLREVEHLRIAGCHGGHVEGRYTPLMVVMAMLALRRTRWAVAVAVIDLLLAAGADVAVRNAQGLTAWDVFFRVRFGAVGARRDAVWGRPFGEIERRVCPYPGRRVGGSERSRFALDRADRRVVDDIEAVMFGRLRKGVRLR
ncbi:hypothetical protein F4780DRAFT_787090 [Xylariomycetidae sp. FL0641]|nr:hypothetical protein F4780DRAFT_787090 [Xylariomycetidae sp. FL0641]